MDYVPESLGSGLPEKEQERLRYLELWNSRHLSPAHIELLSSILKSGRIDLYEDLLVFNYSNRHISKPKVSVMTKLKKLFVLLRGRMNGYTSTPSVDQMILMFFWTLSAFSSLALVVGMYFLITSVLVSLGVNLTIK